MIAGAVANGMVPIDQNSTLEMWTRNAEIQGTIARISPCTLYGEATGALLTPALASLNPALMMISSAAAGRLSNPLPLGQSLLLVWPQLVSIIALSVICFAISYFKFMREEIRSV
ncbi:MAG: ABC transporter, partial [Chloroflexota bacterium]|nr:ABC transporter [Chloroflexota bacterium]